MLYLVEYNKLDEFHSFIGVGRQIVEASNKIEAIIQAKQVISKNNFCSWAVRFTAFTAPELKELAV